MISEVEVIESSIAIVKTGFLLKSFRTFYLYVDTADILISEYGGIDLEDETDGSLLLNGTDSSSTDAGGRFRFELATDDNITINYPAV